MLETIFSTIHAWMSQGSAVATFGCFLWGVISVVLSPCHLASIPLIVAYVGGQQKVLAPREAGTYALAFTVGLFLTIALIGAVCAMVGQLLGGFGIYWQITVGLVLVWVALAMFGVRGVSLPGNALGRLALKGLTGAFLLGLAYGGLSGSCTLGFIAPVLALVTVQENAAAGFILILLFAVGHCLPIVIAGTFGAAMRLFVENRAWQNATQWFRKGAAVIIMAIAVYFIVSPFFY